MTVNGWERADLRVLLVPIYEVVARSFGEGVAIEVASGPVHAVGRRGVTDAVEAPAALRGQGHVPHLEFGAVVHDGAPEADVLVLPGHFGAEDGVERGSLRVLHKTGEVGAVKDFVVVDQEMQVRVVHGASCEGAGTRMIRGLSSRKRAGFQWGRGGRG